MQRQAGGRRTLRAEPDRLEAGLAHPSARDRRAAGAYTSEDTAIEAAYSSGLEWIRDYG